MTIFEYHSKMDAGMLRIACSGTPHEVCACAGQQSTLCADTVYRSASSMALKLSCRYQDASNSTPDCSKSRRRRTGVKSDS